MLLKLFKANYFYNYILFPVTGFLLLLSSLIKGGEFPTENCNYTTPICLLLYNSDLSFRLAVILNYALVIIICFLLLQINAKFAFIKERTFLPVYVFLFIVYAIPEFHVVQPIFFSAIFILISIRSLFNSFEKRSAITNAFDAGIFIGIAGLFYFYLNILVVIVPISLFILKNKITWREIIAPIIGLLIPWLFIFTYYYVWKDISQLIELISNSFIKHDATLVKKITVQTYIVYLLIITFISSIFILMRYGEKNISTRRFFKILAFYFGGTFLLLSIPSVSFEIIVILAIPLTYLITNYLIFMRRKFWAELFMTLLVLISITIQIFH